MGKIFKKQPQQDNTPLFYKACEPILNVYQDQFWPILGLRVALQG